MHHSERRTRSLLMRTVRPETCTVRSPDVRMPAFVVLADFAISRPRRAAAPPDVGASVAYFSGGKCDHLGILRQSVDIKTHKVDPVRVRTVSMGFDNSLAEVSGLFGSRGQCT